MKNRSMDWLGISYTGRGDFWFRVAGDGSVSGRATVVYTPAADTSGVDQRISYLKGVEGAVSGLLGIPGAAATLGMNGLTGLKVDWTEPLAVRQGALAGVLKNGTLSLHWADKAMDHDSLGAKVYLVYLAPSPHNESISDSSTAFGLDTPWPSTATVSSDGGQEHAEAKTSNTSQDGGITVKSDGAWQAVAQS